MRQRLFGTTGVEVSVVGQGTWPVPDITALRRGIDLGMTHIDTAEMYGNGRSEEIVGEAIRGIVRERLFLVTKVLPENGGRDRLIRSCEASLRRLGVDEIDLYLLHWRGDVDLAETMEGLERLVESGKTRAIGVSNLDPWDLREASAALSTVPIACDQVLYNLAERTVEEHELPWLREHGAALVAYTPLAGVPGSDATGSARSQRAALEEIAAAHRVTPQVVALAFLLRDPQVFVIPKAAQIPHVEANALAGECVLTDEETTLLERLFPRRTRRGALPMN